MLIEYKGFCTLCCKQKQHSYENFYVSIYNITRFLEAQDKSYYDYPSALEEMKNGRKIGHWIWYVFPYMKGLGHSAKSELYGIAGRDEAETYLQNDVLNGRLHDICKALLLHKGKLVNKIFGSIDAEKVKASMTLFDAVSPNDIYAQVLDAFFYGERDQRTLELLNG